MSDRRTFLRRAAGGAALAALADARALFAARLEEITEGVGDGPDLQALADQYLLSPNVVYLNHASIGTIPAVVHRAHRLYLELCEKNPWLYIWGDGWEEPLEEVRQKAAGLLGCESGEVAITHNTTEGFNVLAQGLPLGPGDEVLFSSLNHPGASVCWEHQARVRGFRVRRFDFPVREVPGLTADEVVELHMSQVTESTRVLVFPHVDNIVGLRHPLRALSRAAHDRGVEFVAVDGAQTVGMFPVEVGLSGVDFYATSAHKWLQAPKGLGLLYMGDHVRERVRPMWVTWGQETWRGTVRVFEDYGTRNLPEVIALGDAIDFQAEIDPEARESRLRAHRERLREAAEASARLVWRSPRQWEEGASLYFLQVARVDSQALFRRLYEEEGIVFRPFRTLGLEGIRISPNVQTGDVEIGRLLAALRA